MTKRFFYIETIQPKFDELYRSYESSLTQKETTEHGASVSKRPVIKSKTLELMAQDIGNLDTGTNLINFLVECGVNREIIEYPQTKWRMVFDVLLKLSNSGTKESKKVLFKIIGHAVHPLLHMGNKVAGEALRQKFNDYLSYDRLGIGFDENEKNYFVAPLATEDLEEQALFEWEMEVEEKDKKQLEFLSLPENKERISLLRKVYQLLMNVVEVFCENPSNPTSDLNNVYVFLDKLFWDTVRGLRLRGNEIRNFNNYTSPFINLFGAEKHYREQGKTLNWKNIRPIMNAMYGDIETLYQEVNGSDILAEPEKQKKLNDIQLYLSELREQENKDKEESSTQKLLNAFDDAIVKGLKNIMHAPQQTEAVQKIEIVSGKMEVEGLRDGLEAIAQTKNADKKTKFPYKLPAGTRWEEITLKFLDTENIYIQVKQYKHTASYKELGLIGRGEKPSELWAFLNVLAQLNGELTIKDAAARDKYKKQKELVAKALQSYFLIDYDPFFPYRSSAEKSANSYKIKLTLIPLRGNEGAAEESKHNIDFKEYWDEQAPQVYEE